MRIEKKARLSVYLAPELMRSLADCASRRSQSRSLIAEAAVASFLSLDADDRREAVVVKRLDSLDRRLQRLERDVGISLETIALFVRFWLASTPQLPNVDQAATRAKGGERYDSFLDALGRRLAAGRRLPQEISEEFHSTSE